MKFTPLGIVFGAAERHYDKYIPTRDKILFGFATAGAFAMIKPDFGLDEYIGALAGIFAGNWLGYNGYQKVIKEMHIREHRK